jgi:hypothetical protein
MEFLASHWLIWLVIALFCATAFGTGTARAGRLLCNMHKVWSLERHS